MTFRISRNFAALCLPTFVSGGVLLWQSRATLIVAQASPQNVPQSAARPAKTRAVSAATAPQFGSSLRFGRVDIKRLGPVYSQNIWSDQDCLVQVPIIAREILPSPATANPRHRSSLSNLDNSLGRGNWKLSSERGVLASPSVIVLDAGNRMTSPEPIFVGRTGAKAPLYLAANAMKFRYNWTRRSIFDLDRQPNSLGALFLNAAFALPDGRTTPLKIEVRPRWFTQVPLTLYLDNVKWLPPQRAKGALPADEGSVVVTVRYAGKKTLLVRNEPRGSIIAWSAAPDSSGKTARALTSRPKLLPNWSPRLENSEGSYNSHTAADEFVWSKIRQPNAQISSYSEAAVAPYLAEFLPRVQADAPQQRGALTSIRYHLYGLQRVPGQPVFKTEIGVSGDGFLRVSVPLSRAK